MSRIAVLCPTRGRPEAFAALHKSVLDTSQYARVYAYVDDDQRDLYGESSPRGTMTYGPRIGPVASANNLARDNEADVYGLITDDSIITTPGWDEWILSVMAELPYCVVSPHHNHGDHVDMPFVSKKWIEQTGWFACPYTYHYCWPIITGLIGEMTAICHAPNDKFSLTHLYTEDRNHSLRDLDYRAYFSFTSSLMMPLVDNIRKAMYPEGSCITPATA